MRAEMKQFGDASDQRPSFCRTRFLAVAFRRWMGGSALLFVLMSQDVRAIAQTQQSNQASCNDPGANAQQNCQESTSSTDTQIRSPQGQYGNGRTNGLDSGQLYRDPAGSQTRQRNDVTTATDEFFRQDPLTDFQRLAQSSTGEVLPIFGRDFFRHAPSTFAPADQIPVTSDYVVGPGDEVLVRLWGPDTFNSQLTVDTSGSIYIPKVGAIRVAGLRYDELQKHITTEVSRVFRNFNLSVNLGRLRSIQIYVVGEAQRPGAYTISSLSSVLNGLFASGGPNVQGSLRRIQIRRDGQPTSEFDLYDLVLRGDKSKDIRLQQGDTLFIQAAGPEVAIAGSVRHPAVYELRGEESIADLLKIAGGYNPTAAVSQLSLERIDANHSRKALGVAMDREGLSIAMRDGDVLFVHHIDHGYEKSVTIRGNLANPGRFAWHPGMRLSEIIPDRMALLTSDYWRERNLLGVPTPLFEPLPQSDFELRTNPSRTVLTPNSSQQSSDGRTGQDIGDASRSQYQRSSLGSSQLTLSGENATQQAVALPAATTSSASDDRNNQNPASAPSGAEANTVRVNSARQKIQLPAPEINWSYAVVERLDAQTLRNSLLPFNLGKLVQDHDANQDLELQPGDVVTILSQADISVPMDERTKYVRLEGEFVGAGIYSVRAGENLADVVRRAGGITNKAYLYGSSFLRESARALQQQRLDEYISTLASDMDREASIRAASSTSGVIDPNALVAQQSLINRLRQAKATGRVVFEFLPESAGIDAIPNIPLENGDIFRIPSRPNTVSVIGAVYGQNVFMYNQNRRVEDYIDLAGKPNRIADRKHAFIIRADGSIFSRELAQGIWNNHFNNSRINPGDSIVIPEKLIKPTAIHQLLEYAQVLSSLGIAAAVINSSR